jgi:hypothetical protein
MKILYPIYLAVMLIMSHTLFAQVPKLNSYPSAAAVIYLDFDGHTVNGTSWNSSGPIYAGPSNLSEDKIVEIFNRVAEDYRPFNINVTTDSAKYWSAPAKRRMRALLTITWEWYGRAGGVAFTNSFIWGDNTPCFIFTSLHNYRTKDIAEAASHEIGHTLGLRHQARYNDVCVKTEDYNSGTGSGQVSWAPIMGVGYYRNQTTWHNGPNPFGCTSAQDDLSIITSTANGFGYRPDDHGATFTTASNLPISDKKITEIGNITTNTDEDMFKVTLPADGALKLQVAPYSVSDGEAGSNLDVELKLYNNKLKLVNSYNPTETLSAAIDTTLSGGDYYIAVTGAGNMYATDYASLGAYTIKGSVGEFAVLPLRRLELKGMGNGNQHQLNWLIDADEAIVKQVLEVAENGGAFAPVAQLDAASRNTTHFNPVKGAVQYRLSVTFDNGKQHYSNTIAIRNNAAGKPQLYTNVISSNALMVSSPSVYTYTITDINGRQMAKGQVTEGSSTINMGNITAGMYLIRFNNGSEQHVEKFSKR